MYMSEHKYGGDKLATPVSLLASKDVCFVLHRIVVVKVVINF